MLLFLIRKLKYLVFIPILGIIIFLAVYLYYSWKKPYIQDGKI